MKNFAISSSLALCILSACGSSSSEGPSVDEKPTKDPLEDQRRGDSESKSNVTAPCGIVFDEDTSPTAFKSFADSLASTWSNFQCSAPPGEKFSTYSTDFAYSTDAAGKPVLEQFMRFNPCGGDPNGAIKEPIVRRIPEESMGKTFRTRISKPLDIDGIPFRIVEWSTTEGRSFRCHVTAFAKVFDQGLKDNVLYESMVQTVFGEGSRKDASDSKTAQEFIAQSYHRLLGPAQRPQWFR